MTTEQGLVPQNLGNFSSIPSDLDALLFGHFEGWEGELLHFDRSRNGIFKDFVYNSETHCTVELFCFLHL